MKISESLSSNSFVSSSSVQSSTSLMRRSNRISERAKRQEIMKLLERPSASVEEKERRERLRIVAHERKRKREEADHQKAIDEFEDYREAQSDKRLKKREEVESLKEMANSLRKELTPEMIKEIFYDNLDYFENIEIGVEDSWRFKAFKKGGKKDHELRFHEIGPPFSDEQQDLVFAEVKSIWLKNKTMDRFVDVVLLPEIFIKLYAVFFGLSKSAAEKNITCYEGSREQTDSDEDMFI